MQISNAQLSFSTWYRAMQETKSQETTRVTKANGDVSETTQATRKFWEVGSASLTLPSSRIWQDATSLPEQDKKNPLENLAQDADGGQGNKGEVAANAETADALDRRANNDPYLNFIRIVVEMFTGRKVNILETALRDPNVTDAQSMVSWGYSRDKYYTETEQSSFAAEGIVHTADGMEIRFQISLSMAYSYHEEEHFFAGWSARPKSGDRPPTDPLVLNFAGNAAELSNMTFSFDFEANGQEKQMHALKPGSGFLVFDRNGDGKVNDGSELFGPKSGDGFAELAALDEDGNGWIDENDSVFNSLYLWTKNSKGEDVMMSLKEANVGAISLTYADTPFSLKDAGNTLLGQVRATGVFLKEDGSVGTIQRVDMVV